MSIGSFERCPLLFGPSPVHPPERRSAHLGGEPALNAYSALFPPSRG